MTLLSRIWTWLTADTKPIPPEVIEHQLFTDLWW